ncbi:MAG TPA: chromate transporter [Exilispira sp.]|nr:chromate transporter [Exilispira sp.]
MFKFLRQNKTLAFYISLFWQFFSISAFTLGGGYVMVAVMQQNFVEKKKYLGLEKFTELLASAQLLPGPIALTSSIFLGNEIAGGMGAIIGILGTTLPPFFAIYLVYMFISILDAKIVDLFMIGVKAATIAAITQFLLKIFKNKKYDFIGYLILLIFTLIGLFFQLSPILILLIGGFSFFILNFIKIKYF